MADMEGIRYVRATNIHTSFTRGPKRCLRQGERIHRHRGPRIELPNTVQLVAPNKVAWLSAWVYRVSLSPEVHAKWHRQPQTFHVVAESDHAVKSYLEKRFTNIAKRFMGAARFALTTAMRALSTRSVTHSGQLGAAAARVGMTNIRVESFGGAGGWTVAIHDDLRYAAQAFKSGPNAVQLAMAKAANSIAGMLRKRAGDLLDPSLATPFPEIAQHRRSS